MEKTKPKTRKRKCKVYFLTFLLLITGLLIFYFPWVSYVYSLAENQAYAIWHREKLAKVLQSDRLSKAQKSKLEIIEKSREFGKKLYHLNDSNSYEYYVNLPRKALGWNLTVADSLKMQAREFQFPFVGSFGYLGFFNEGLKNKWKENFKKQGYDVYENEIGAYSTLGYFKDPIFSTYLDWDDVALARLVFHEMAHEKLYFTNDSDFSEALAVFIEKVAANFYFYGSPSLPEYIHKKHRTMFREYNIFETMIEDTKKKLEKIYGSQLSPEDKLKKKTEEIENLKKKLTQTPFVNFPYAHEVAQMEDLNNAFFVQNWRYTPHGETGFSVLLKDCNNDVVCWFERLSKLKKCKPEIRKKFLLSPVKLDKVLSQCKPA